MASPVDSAAPNSAPDGGCRDGRHRTGTGICPACGEWLPTAWCRAAGCGWREAIGEPTIAAAVRHHAETGHPIRVLID
ncbi:hypothetical protein H4696_001201 [Amycolatopsis lexingtonensis]|uniref:Uncharacterized protein n=1 Tax=Amycolatopsis lexingtonensis TaxID=218822 RepID=A0ABR9HT41_9PSEU|nr:hypothetical protein [Amycolatopsis lexingtonensis]MBE1494101.1 hypothetical protein [Amycolatopsis lexingtonensis]